MVNNADKTEIIGFEVDGTMLIGDYFTLVGQVGHPGRRAQRLRRAVRSGSGAAPSAPRVFRVCRLVTATTISLPAQQLPRAPDWNWSLTGIWDQNFGSDPHERVADRPRPG